MTWVLWSLVFVVVGGCFVLASGRGGSMAESYDDRPDVLVPAHRLLTGDDLRSVGFTTALRGYRMAEVDALLERLAVELDRRDGHAAEGGIGDVPDVPDVTA